MKQTVNTAVVLAIACCSHQSAHADESAESIRKSVTLYASFDNAVTADYAKGKRDVATRYNPQQRGGAFEYKSGYPKSAFVIAKGKGVQGGALNATDVLPRRGRLFFPAKGNIAFNKTGWSGSVSVWINTNPDKMLKTKYCDPVQITQKGATNGGIWFDFIPTKPRDMRLGIFKALKKGEKPTPQKDPKAPLIVVKKVGFKAGDWHHVVLTWHNLDTGKPNASATLYVDGKRIGTLSKREIAMKWQIEKSGIYFAVNFIGLLDELAVFDRALTAKEVAALHKHPGLLSTLKRK